MATAQRTRPTASRTQTNRQSLNPFPILPVCFSVSLFSGTPLNKLRQPVLSLLLLTTIAHAQTIAPPKNVDIGAANHASSEPSVRPKLVGYFGQWSLYNEPRYLVKDLVSTGGAAMLDQLNYAQGFVTNGHCSVADPNADLNIAFSAKESVNGRADNPNQPFRGYLHQLAELKRRYPHLKLVLSLEGKPTDFAYDAQPEHRKAFLDSCVDLFLKGHLAPGVYAPHLFDGIDIDWEYPHADDSANYLALVTELRQRMDALHPGMILSIAAGPSPHMYEGINLAAVSQIADEIGLITYDFAGPWMDHTGFVAPLSTPNQAGSVQRTVQAYRDAGVPASKLLVGIPFYGYGWREVPATANGLYQEGTAIHGDRPYRYIQSLTAHSTVYRDPISQAPWLFDGDAFWTYEDSASIRAKADFALDQHIGGLMIWELSEDSADATLLHAAHNALKHPATEAAQSQETSTPPAESLPANPAN